MATNFLLFLILRVVPPILVLVSKRAVGTEKAIWFLVSVLLSWLGFIAFLMATANRNGSQPRST